MVTGIYDVAEVKG